MDLTTDPLNCGACGTACAAPANANPVCVGGAFCDYQCAVGTKFRGACATFGGAFTTGDGSAGCAVSTCKAANPYTGTCACPAGFGDAYGGRILDDTNCSPPPAPDPFGWASLHVCTAGTVAAGADFQGTYFLNENGMCGAGNPFTGGCTCPAEATSIVVPMDGSCWKRTKLVACFKPSAPRSTFGGVYSVADRDYGCLAGNPATGGCSCPAGTVGRAVRSIYGTPPNGCSALGQFGALVYFCGVP